LPGSLVYLDASALVKLVAVEPESSALAQFLGDWESRITSRISTVEVTRAARRPAMPELVERASVVLDGVSFVELSPEIARLAGLLDPPTFRSLDAMHVASALSLGADVGPFLTYDARMREAATAAGLDVRAPA
jgi:predicted nucleic acid-binding protein